MSSETHKDYHDDCLSKLFGSADIVPALEMTRKDFFIRANTPSGGTSVSGAQAKATLAIRNRKLEIYDKEDKQHPTELGTHIIKPTPESLPFLSENEHLTMRIFEEMGIEVPPCGLVTFNEREGQEHKENAYIIKRYDRTEEKPKTHLHQEDMMQILRLSGEDAESKFTDASYYDVLLILKNIGGRPLQKRFMNIMLASYIVGNDDLHLKNISLVHTKPAQMAPAYDQINTLLYGKKFPSMGLKFYSDKTPYSFSEIGDGSYSLDDFIELAESAGLPGKAIRFDYGKICKKWDAIESLVRASYLPEDMQDKYLKALNARRARLEMQL